MRNGVLAVTNDGAVAVLNAEACRIFGMTADPADIGRPYNEVLRIHPDVVRVLASAFELSHLPNRVEMRLKSTGRVIGYTLSHVRDASGALTGIALFFKDLTRVEQLEERERLRDRLAALGEMAAAIAHELKNPLAGIEVMAGLLRRKVPGSPDAQSILTDIINEAKMANATVVEVLDYVRPLSLETERTSIADVLHAALLIAEGKAPRGGVQVHTSIPGDLPGGARRSSPALSGVHQPVDQRFRGAGRTRLRSGSPPSRAPSRATTHSPTARHRSRRWSCRSPTMAPGCRRRWWTGCSTRSSRRRHRARASGWRSCGRSWTRTTAASTSARRPGSAPGSP